FSGLDSASLRAALTNTIGASHYFLKDASSVLITYGTAWVYTRKETGEIVANCHKSPASMFTKSLLSADAITQSFTSLYGQLKRFNPHIRVILTVSPVRHVKDTLEGNAVSKAVLRL